MARYKSRPVPDKEISAEPCSDTVTVLPVQVSPLVCPDLMSQ